MDPNSNLTFTKLLTNTCRKKKKNSPIVLFLLSFRLCVCFCFFFISSMFFQLLFSALADPWSHGGWLPFSKKTKKRGRGRKKVHIKQIVWQAFYETTQQGVGVEVSGGVHPSCYKGAFTLLLSRAPSPRTHRKQFILANSPCGPGITHSSAVLKAGKKEEKKKRKTSAFIPL